MTARTFRLDTIIHRDKSYIIAGEYQLGVLAYLEIVTPEAAHVLYDDRANLSSFHQRKHFFDGRSVEVGAGVSVIDEISDVPKALILREFLQDGALILNGVGLAIQVVLVGETAVERGNLLLIHFFRDGSRAR